jgi:hypothetical protein
MVVPPLEVELRLQSLLLLFVQAVGEKNVDPVGDDLDNDAFSNTDEDEDDDDIIRRILRLVLTSELVLLVVVVVEAVDRFIRDLTRPDEKGPPRSI